VIVDNVDNTLNEITKAGSKIVTQRTSIGSGNEAYATFRF
jgi:hypothetical protein